MAVKDCSEPPIRDFCIVFQCRIAYNYWQQLLKMLTNVDLDNEIRQTCLVAYMWMNSTHTNTERRKWEAVSIWSDRGAVVWPHLLPNGGNIRGLTCLFWFLCHWHTQGKSTRSAKYSQRGQGSTNLTLNYNKVSTCNVIYHKNQRTHTPWLTEAWTRSSQYTLSLRLKQKNGDIILRGKSILCKSFMTLHSFMPGQSS